MSLYSVPKTRKIRKNVPGCMSILLRSCIQLVFMFGPQPSLNTASSGFINGKTRLLHGFLSDPTTAASEHSSVKRGLTGSRAVQGRFCRNLHVPFQRAQNTKKQKNVPGCMSILLRSCIQHSVQEVPVLVGPMAQGTPPQNFKLFSCSSLNPASTQLQAASSTPVLHGLFTKSQVKSFQKHLSS